MENKNQINLNISIAEKMSLRGINAFTRFLQNKKDNTDLTFAPVDVLYFFEHIKSQKNYRQNTIYYYLTTIRSYCNAHFVHSPNSIAESQFISLFKRLKINRPYTVYEYGDTYTKDDIDSILKIAKPKEKAFVLGLYFTIGRITEVISIKLKDCKVIDSELTEIVIQHGKGNRVRTVIIPTEIYLEIVKIFDSKTYLFESKPDKKYHPRTIGARLRELGAKYKKRLTPHLLRHSAITFLIEQGVDITVISKLSGTSIVVLLKTYNHPKFDKKKIIQMMKENIQNPFQRKTK